MGQYGWESCPEPVRIQVEGFLDALRKVLEDNIIGVYLHGSLALGCFNPERSDLDLLVVTERGMEVETKRRMAELLLRYSAAPIPIEVSFLSQQDLDPWRYPTPYDFHYSEEWREKYERHLLSGEWTKWNKEPQTDEDLASHITVALRHGRHGVCLYGRPIEKVFPSVPEEHYIASILSDFQWARDRIAQLQTYFILNSCRVYVYLMKGQVCSKEEAGAWALQVLAEEFRELVAQALDVYRGDREEEGFDEVTLNRFAEHMAEQLRALLRGRDPHAGARFLSGK